MAVSDAAAGFSFFLAMHMVGAFACKLHDEYATLTFDQAGFIAIGFVSAFVAPLLLVPRACSIWSPAGWS